MITFSESTVGRVLVIATLLIVIGCAASLAFVLGGLRSDRDRSLDTLHAIKEELVRAESSRQSILTTIVTNQRTVIANEEILLKRLDALEK